MFKKIYFELEFLETVQSIKSLFRQKRILSPYSWDDSLYGKANFYLKKKIRQVLRRKPFSQPIPSS
jgi:hypothetical protein